MTTRGYELIVNRGESFTLKYKIKLRNGEDFTVPVPDDASKAKYYYLLKIASSKYEQEGRYVKRWLIDINEDEPNLIEKTFDIITTSEWIGQHYLYSIDLVLAEELEGEDTEINILDSISILPPTKFTVIGDIQGGEYK